MNTEESSSPLTCKVSLCDGRSAGVLAAALPRFPGFLPCSTDLGVCSGTLTGLTKSLQFYEEPGCSCKAGKSVLHALLSAIDYSWTFIVHTNFRIYFASPSPFPPKTPLGLVDGNCFEFTDRLGET